MRDGDEVDAGGEQRAEDEAKRLFVVGSLT